MGCEWGRLLCRREEKWADTHTVGEVQVLCGEGQGAGRGSLKVVGVGGCKG